MFTSRSENPNESISRNKLPPIRRSLMGFMGLALSLSLMGDAYPSDLIQLNHPKSVAVDENKFKIITANVRGWQGAKGNNFSQFSGVLKQEKPDVVCMQEVRAEGDELSRLYEQGYNVIFSSTKRNVFGDRFGNAVLSRGPMKLVEIVKLSNPDSEQPRNGILVSIGAPKNKIEFLNMHLSIYRPESSDQAQTAYQEVGDSANALCGDMNQQPDTVKNGPFGKMMPISTQRNPTLTFPARNPDRQIDYILPTNDCGIVDQSATHTIDIGSDHLALSVTMDMSDCKKL